MNKHQILQDTIARHGNAPSNALEALAHVVSVYEATPDDQTMVLATSNVYGDGVRTGLTMGDLRVLLGLLQG
jgi:hypothetical protein